MNHQHSGIVSTSADVTFACRIFHQQDIARLKYT
jgi:hypothetical protein